MVYTKILKYPFEKNWANDVMMLKQEHGLSMDEASVDEWVEIFD